MKDWLTQHNGIMYVLVAVVFWYMYTDNARLREDNEVLSTSYSTAIGIISNDVYLLKQKTSRVQHISNLSNWEPGYYETKLVTRYHSNTTND